MKEKVKSIVKVLSDLDSELKQKISNISTKLQDNHSYLNIFATEQILITQIQIPPK
jgi:hypothetical protein